MCREYEDYYKMIEEKANESGRYLAFHCFKFMGDNNSEDLELLREFRDTYLKKHEEGRKLLDLYYDVATILIDKLNDSKDRSKYYALAYDEIKKCIDFIKNKEYEKATAQYIYVVLKLSADLLTENRYVF